MNKTIAQLLEPRFAETYGTVGERAVILQQLMASARKFRAPGPGEPCPPWSPYRETFVEFLQRSITFIKTRKASDSRNI